MFKFRTHFSALTFQWTDTPFKNTFRVSNCYDGDQINENEMAVTGMDLFSAEAPAGGGAPVPLRFFKKKSEMKRSKYIKH
jgi:hypothetical protein